MAAFDVKRVALVIVVKGVFISWMTLTGSSACNSDPEACRYDCPAEVIQNHNCTSENPVHDAVEGKCCPGFFKTDKKCQVCPDGRFMPDVNNCSECLLCTDCDTPNVANNTLEFPCNLTTNAVCKMTDDPTPCAHPGCPWIKSSSAAPTTSTQVPTTQVPTTEAASVNTPRGPLESTSKEPYKAGFFAIMALFFLSLVVILLLCIYICKKGQGVDEGDANGNNRNNNGEPGERVALQAVAAVPE